MMSRTNSPSHSRALLRKIIVLSLYFLLIGAAQCSFFPQLRFLSSTPNVMLGAVVAVCLCEEQKSALVCSIAAGFLIDAIGAFGYSLSPLSFFGVALLCTPLAKKMLPKLPSYILMLLPASLVGALFTALNILLRTGFEPPAQMITKYLLPELLLTLLFSIPLFYITKLVLRLAQKKTKFKI